jgi:hypothetical protein
MVKFLGKLFPAQGGLSDRDWRNLHIICFLFYGLALFAGLWQHGHPFLTVGILAATAPLAAVAFLPERWFPFTVREYLQLLVIAGALLWGGYRFLLRVPPDKALIETISLLGLSFALTARARARDYGYMLLVASLLLLYGALIPRQLYLMIVPAAFFLGLLYLYLSRPVALAGDSGVSLPRSLFRHNWSHLTLHFFLAALLWLYMCSLMPSEDRPGKGLIPVSFRTSNESFFAPDFSKWLESEKHRSSSAARRVSDSASTQITFLEPSGKFVTGTDRSNSMSVYGRGSGIPGDDLVFRVKCPLKLYWLAQLYDVYTGVEWQSTERMRAQRISLTNEQIDASVLCPQRFIVEKWVSPVLFGAYLGGGYSIGFSRKNEIKTQSSFYGERFLPNSPYPALPFTYDVNSRIFLWDESASGARSPAGFDTWHEKLKPAHYLQLPDGKITARLREFSKNIVKDSPGGLPSALALRDWLRTNCKYTQFSEPAPFGSETVDFFIFGPREGHCEYFASALAVMARVNGLPSRVATGFSPGNYNTLNKHFEVHEYHAHAWTQIYVKERGWLTFDATPPGSVVSKTLPVGIGGFQDPFGDDWRVTPPELAFPNMRALAAEKVRQAEERAAGEGGTLQSEVVVKIAMLPEKIEKSAEKVKAGLAKTSEASSLSIKSFYKKVKENLIVMAKRFWGSIQFLVAFLFSRNGIIVLDVALILAAVIYLSPMIYSILNRRSRIKRCAALLAGAAGRISSDPAEVVSACYRVTRDLLDLAGRPRKNNMELFDYGVSLKDLNMVLCKDALVVYYLYSQTEYGERMPSQEEARTALIRTKRIRNFLLAYIRQRNYL